MSKAYFLTCVLWWISFWGSAAPVILVLRPENVSGDPKVAHWAITFPLLLKDVLRQNTGVRLAPDGSFDFVSDLAIEHAFRELRLTQGTKCSVEQATKIADLVQADIVIWSDYNREDKSWMLTLEMARADNAFSSKAWKINSTNWFEIVTKSRQCLFEQLGVKTEKRDSAELNQMSSFSLESLELTSQALAEKFSGSPLSTTRDLLQRAISIDQKFVLPKQILATILYGQGNLEEAKTIISTAIRAKSGLARSHYILGVINLMDGSNEAALAEFRTAQRLDAHESHIPLRFGELFYSEQKWSEALSYLKKAEALSPFDAVIHAEVGRAYISMGKTNEGMNALRIAEQNSDASEVGINLILGKAYAELGYISKAEKNYRKFIHAGRLVGVDAQLLDQADAEAALLEARMTPHYIERPDEITLQKESREVLTEKLTPKELDRIISPFAITKEMNTWLETSMNDTNELQVKANRLFNQLTRRASLRPDPGFSREEPCLNASEAFERWSAPTAPLNCEDYTFLYVTLARRLGLDAYFVLVDQDFKGQFVCHACAGVVFGDRALLVDPIYLWYGAKHQRFKFLNDAQATGLFLSQKSGIELKQLAVKLAPDVALTWFNLAIGLSDAGRQQEAKSALDSGLQLKPDEWLGCYAKGFIYRNEKKWDEASKNLQKCIQIKPDFSHAHFVMGEVFDAQGMPDEAIIEFRQYLQGQTTSFDAAKARKSVAKLRKTLPDRVGND